MQEVGYMLALYREPTGPSTGTLPAFDGERSKLRRFEGNRAHSNRRVCCAEMEYSQNDVLSFVPVFYEPLCIVVRVSGRVLIGQRRQNHSTVVYRPKRFPRPHPP